MPKENAVEIYGYGGRVFETQEEFDSELLDQVTRAIDALNKVTLLCSAERIWHEPSQFGDVKDYLDRKKMYLERKLGFGRRSPGREASVQAVATQKIRDGVETDAGRPTSTILRCTM